MVDKKWFYILFSVLGLIVSVDSFIDNGNKFFNMIRGKSIDLKCN